MAKGTRHDTIRDPARQHGRTTTLERWEAANHYDRKTRTYRDPDSHVGAVPHAHDMDREHDPHVQERGRKVEPD